MSKETIKVEPVKVETTPEDLERILSTPSDHETVNEKTECIVEPLAPKEKKEPKTLEDLLKNAEKTLEAEGVEPTEEEVEESKDFLNKFMGFVKGKEFDNKCEDLSKKYNVPKKQIAKSFLSKALGTISDMLHIGIGAVEDFAGAVLTLIYNIINSGIRIACNLARNLATFVTFNKTAINN